MGNNNKITKIVIYFFHLFRKLETKKRRKFQMHWKSWDLNMMPFTKWSLRKPINLIWLK